MVIRRRRKAIRHRNPFAGCAPVRLATGRRYNAWVGSKVNWRGNDYEIVGCGTEQTASRMAGALKEGTYAMRNLATDKIRYVPKRRVRDEAYHRGGAGVMGLGEGKGRVRAARRSEYSRMFRTIEQKEQVAAAKAAEKAAKKAKAAEKALQKALKKAKSASQQSLVLANGRRRKSQKTSLARMAARDSAYLDRLEAGHMSARPHDQYADLRRSLKRSVRRNPAKRGKLTGAAKQEFLARMAAGRRRAARR